MPAYLRTARLPSYMRLVQYVDVRGSDGGRLDVLAHRLVGKIPDNQLRTRSPRPPSSGSKEATISLSAETAAELTRIIDVLVSGGREIRFDVRMRGHG